MGGVGARLQEGVTTGEEGEYAGVKACGRNRGSDGGRKGGRGNEVEVRSGVVGGVCWGGGGRGRGWGIRCGRGWREREIWYGSEG